MAERIYEEPKGALGLWCPCLAMSAGSLLLAEWARLSGMLEGAPVHIWPADPVWVALMVAGSLLAGVGSAGLCVEMQRVYGSLESDVILFHGVGSYVVSLVIALLLSFLPLPFTLVLWVLSPLPVAKCLLVEHGELTRKELYGRGEGTPLKLPWKLLITSLLHGLSLGVIAGLAMDQGQVPFVVCAGISYLVSSVLVIAVAFAFKMNFNSLIYQIAFPMIALGLYALYALEGLPLIGLSIDLIGFSYLHLVMWCVCSFLIKRFDMPSMWVTGTSTCFFMVGQLAGSIGSSAASHVGPDGDVLDVLMVTTMFVMLAASLFMISNQNMRTGWGIARPDAASRREETPLDVAIVQLAAQCSLTDREFATLELLGRGRNRAAIAEELGVSRETVKTHISGVYRKAHVHSQQELIDLLEERAKQVRSDE